MYFLLPIKSQLIVELYMYSCGPLKIKMIVLKFGTIIIMIIYTYFRFTDYVK